MLDLGNITLGVREGVIVLIALVAIYMGFVLWRMRRIRRMQNLAASPMPPDGASAGRQDDTASKIPVTEEALWERAPVGMAEEMVRASLEQEVAQLRDEVDAIRGELAALREDMLQELAHFESSQSASPLYGDAMQMAAAGYDAAIIAERCGIARAEAELVVALAKSQERGGQE